ncbi:octopamine receptor beta-2R-like [Montipora capricornis]|uniref:octopamine receptor beta-2R-like n=1 Tax=Montipora capricornis TaxID=246305 RepID=UPI0035F21BAC
MNQTTTIPPLWVTYLSIAWACTVSTTIVALNTGICVLLWTQRRLRVTGNLFFVNLAIADILVGFVAVPWKPLHYLISPTPLWLISMGTVVDYVLSLSFLSVCALNYDRYLAIIYPLTYPERMAFENMWKKMLLIWSLPCLNFFRLIWMISLRTPERYTKYNKAFGVFHFSVLLVAATGIIFAYIRMFQAARQQKKHIKAISPKKTTRRVKLCKAIRCCLGVTICLICCWLPRGSYLIARNIYTTSSYGPYEYDLLTFALMSLSPVLNPIIYSVCNRDVRKTLMVIIRRDKNIQFRKTNDTLGGSIVSSQSRSTILGSKELLELEDTNPSDIYTENPSMRS